MLVRAMLVTSIVGVYPVLASAQSASAPFHKQAYSWSSGPIDGTGQRSDSAATHDVISVTGAPWLRLDLTGTKLRQRSYIEISSLQDGASQVLDAATLSQWNFESAYFNGDAVEIELFVDPNDRGVVVNVPVVTVGEHESFDDAICGADDRVASMEPRVARIEPKGCTVFIINNGQHLTAGHCLDRSGNRTLSFNLPPSLPNGTRQFPGPKDQYSIDQSSYKFRRNGSGDDWGIFGVFDNAMTGVQPIDVQGFFDIKQDLSPANIRITGFGTDKGVTNVTNQTQVGPNAGSSRTTMRYRTDTTGGNSGSPVIDDATGEVVGIHTHGGCTRSRGNNKGTSFFNRKLWAAITAVDPPSPLVCPEGTIDFSTTALRSYSKQNITNNTSVGDNGNSLTMTGNTWVRSSERFNITSSTVIDFMFASTSQGEIHAIGFDNNSRLNDAPRLYQFWGTQNWSNTGKIDLTPKYSGGGDFQAYSVPVGRSYVGNMFLVLVNDKDRGTLNNRSRFACVRVR